MIRPATLKDTPAILRLVNGNAKRGLMLPKSPYDVYRNIQSFFVHEEEGGQVLGCARLAVLWNDIGEVASLAVAEEARKRKIGTQLVEAVLERARGLGLAKVISLTYQREFFAACGFREVNRDSLPHKVFGDCLNCPKVDCCDESAYMYVL